MLSNDDKMSKNDATDGKRRPFIFKTLELLYHHFVFDDFYINRVY